VFSWNGQGVEKANREARIDMQALSTGIISSFVLLANPT